MAPAWAKPRQQGRITWEDVLLLLRQIVDALEYAHQRGIVHRDLKPANILLDPRKGVLLADFGFARVVGQFSMSASISDGLIGTPAYIAPEIWEERESTPQTDIYALACVVYEILMGEVLFGGKTPVGMMKQHILEGARLPQQWPQGDPAGLGAVLSPMWCVGRYGVAEERGS